MNNAVVVLCVVLLCVASASLGLLCLVTFLRNRPKRDDAAIDAKVAQFDRLVSGGSGGDKPADTTAAGLKLFESPTDGATPDFLLEDDVTLVGHIVGTKGTTGDAFKKDCDAACHANKLCTHWEAPSDRTTCVLKNRPMVAASVDEDIVKFLGFNPLPECGNDKKCSDGYKKGVATGLHPKRMESKAATDGAKTYSTIAEMHRNMNKSMTCDALCKLSKAFQIIGVVFLAAAPLSWAVAGTAGLVLTVTEVGATAAEISLGIVQSKREARTAEQIKKGFEVLVAENTPFMYHNIKGNDLVHVNQGVQCAQFCDQKPKDAAAFAGAGSIGSAAIALDNPETREQTLNAMRDNYNLVQSCCNALDDQTARNTCISNSTSGSTIKIDGKDTGVKWAGPTTHTCRAAEKLFDRVAWQNRPEAPNNFSDSLFRYFKKYRVKF